jgi:hypothetical protein
MKKPVNTHLVIKGIPHGLLTPQEFVETNFGEEMAANLSANDNKPEENLIPFLVAYQYMDLKAQLMALGKHEEPSTPEGEEALRDLAIQNVSENFHEIVQGLGSEGMGVILSAVTRQKVRVILN